ncbi:hypothetical protein Tco_1420996, partial [Tanacetum coccineum]
MKVLGWPTWVAVVEATMVVMDDGSGSGGGHDGDIVVVLGVRLGCRGGGGVSSWRSAVGVMIWRGGVEREKVVCRLLAG